jgi:putative membrane-bound dehydrogenase-like protein
VIEPKFKDPHDKMARRKIGFFTAILTRRAALALIFLAACGCSRKSVQAPDPLSPDKALKSFHLSEDFHVELFAAEPNVVDPVDMAFDENGRIYVAEMIDYPEDPAPGKPPRSRILLLEDRDGDGRVDHSSIFADHLQAVSGILPWKGGVIATAAPDILYLKDTHGDGKADLRQVLYTGFRVQNQQHRVANPRLGTDNWVYAANDGADGRIVSKERPDREPVLVRGADFRFQPITGAAEAASGPTQFGLSFNDWGDRFATSNTFHLHHSVVPMKYLTRSPALIVPAVSEYLYPRNEEALRVYQLTPPQHWREERTRVRQERYRENGGHRVEQLSGYFTAASGGVVYTGDAFPPEYAGDIFTGEVAGNLVRRDKLTPKGPTFTAHAAKPGVEFLASTDVWFRPCNFVNAPDGSLYMLDFYREVIESPEYIPDAIKKHIDFHHGEDRGRIYRIAPNHPLRRGSLKVNLGSASSAELVKQLENNNGWHRETAHRLLLERQDRSVTSLLSDMARKSTSAKARLQALWVLDGIGSLEPDQVKSALSDAEPRVREHALRLAERFLPQDRGLVDCVLKLQRDPDTRVRFQLALTLGQIDDPRAVDTLAALVRGGDSSDPWFRIAISSAAANRPLQLLERLPARDHTWQDPAFLSQLAALIGSRRDSRELAVAITALLRLQHPSAALDGLARGLKLDAAHKIESAQAEAALGPAISAGDQDTQVSGWTVARYFDLHILWPKVVSQAKQSNVPVRVRAAAIRALHGSSFSAARPVLQAVLESSPEPEVQRAAVEAAASFDDPAAGPFLLSYWRTYQPSARGAALESLLSNRERAPLLLDAIEHREIPAASLDVAARNRLLEYPEAKIAARAQVLLQTSGPDRAKLVASYRDVLKLSGDAARGRQVLEKNCGRCHLARHGRAQVGPDLSGVNNKTKEELLNSILNPSAAIDPRYINYIVTTRDGRIHDGVIGNETPGLITLRNGSEDGDDVILRSNVAEMRASAVSLMPEDLEQAMSKQDLADVIAYLRGGI